jgi:glyoxylase-like metal-dependent hydrolase (beta-lactamase superfamily II)
MPKPFASSTDTQEQESTLHELADGVLAYVAEGDPNVGAIVGPDAVVAIDALATPVAARPWLDELRRATELPVRHLVLTHHHAVRALGAAAFGADAIVASRATRELVAERGAADWESELRRMPRLFAEPGSVPGLTWPTLTFDGALSLWLGDREVRLVLPGRGHTAGDLAVWLPEERVLFAGDLVEAHAACYMGDAHVREWMGPTLDAVAALDAEVLVPGRGPAVRGAQVAEAVASTRGFLRDTWDVVAEARQGGAGLADAFAAAHARLAPRYGDWPIFEHCLPFNVARVLDELDGLEPRVWTAQRDAEVWEAVHG